MIWIKANVWHYIIYYINKNLADETLDGKDHPQSLPYETEIRDDIKSTINSNDM